MTPPIRPVNGAPCRQDQGADCGRDQAPRAAEGGHVAQSAQHGDVRALAHAAPLLTDSSRRRRVRNRPINTTRYAKPATVLQAAGAAQLSVV